MVYSRHMPSVKLSVPCLAATAQILIKDENSLGTYVKSFYAHLAKHKPPLLLASSSSLSSSSINR